MGHQGARLRAAPPARLVRTGRASVGTIVLVALTFLLVVGVWLYAHRDLPAIARTKVEGQRIVTAVEAYRRDTGHYPDSLAVLVPKYLPRIVSPAWGLHAWTYKRYSEPVSAGSEPDAREAAASGGSGGRVAEYFELSVPANAGHYPVLFYDITDQRWILNN